MDPVMLGLCQPRMCLHWQGSASMLMGAILTQPVVPVPHGLLVSAWLGHFFGYVVGSLWFVAGALGNIAGIARQQPALSTVSAVE